MHSHHNEPPKQHLAWHETLELHELVAFQANHLQAFKKQVGNIGDESLRGLYVQAIRGTEQNLRELLRYYPAAPTGHREGKESGMEGFYSGQLLGFSKAAVRNYALAITETATPQLRDTFQRHLLQAIRLHADVFYYMLDHGYYPAYNLQQLLANDQANAQKALSM